MKITSDFGAARPGDKVFIKQWKHIFGKGVKPQQHGFIERINGGYHYVRPCRWPRDLLIFELYDCEFDIIERYESKRLKYRQRVRILNPESLDWGRAKPRQFGIVVGARGKQLIVRPEGLDAKHDKCLSEKCLAAA